MNILIVHEVDWVKKTTYEMHHLSELFSIMGHNVYAIDIPDPGYLSSFAIYKKIIGYNRVYDDAHITLFRTPSLPIKGLNRIVSIFTSYFFVKKILKNKSVDVVLLYSVVTNGNSTLKACRELNIPVIHRTFDIIHDLIRENYLRFFVHKIEKSFYTKLGRIIVNTLFMKNWVEDIGGKDIEILPQGVDPMIMKPLPRDSLLEQKFGLDKNSNVVMYLGSIESFSGLDYLIDKVPKILEKDPNFKLLIVGGGSHLENLKGQVKKLSLSTYVIFTDYVPYREIPRYCSLAKLCINTFRKNEMTDRLSPVKIFDLQSCGKPIVVTPLSGLMNDFPGEKCGVIYSELEKFPEIILELLQDESKLELIGKRGKLFIESNFTWKKAAERWISEFERIQKFT